MRFRQLASFCLALILAPNALAQAGKPNTELSTSSETTKISSEIDEAEVTIDGRPVLVVRAGAGGHTAHERADAIRDRILRIARNQRIKINDIHVEPRESWTEILVDNQVLMYITDADAKAADRTQTQLAGEHAEVFRRIIQRYREEHTWNNFLWGVLYSAAATLILLATFWLIVKIGRRARLKVEKWIETSEARLKGQSRFKVPGTYFGSPLLAMGTIFRWALVIALFEAYLTVVLGFFPSTKYISLELSSWLFSQLTVLGSAIVGYLPNLLLVLAICLITFYMDYPLFCRVGVRSS